VIGAPPAPDFDDPIALYTVLMLCTAVGHLDHVPVHVANPHYNLDVLVPADAQTRAAMALNRSADLAERRRNHHLPLTAARMRPATTWVAFFTQQWCRAILSERTQELPARLGERLVSLVCGHSQNLYSARRSALRLHTGFAIRDRDPASGVDQPQVEI